jgi:hypothetical protein
MFCLEIITFSLRLNMASIFKLQTPQTLFPFFRPYHIGFLLPCSIHLLYHSIYHFITCHIMQLFNMLLYKCLFPHLEYKFIKGNKVRNLCFVHWQIFSSA